MEDLKAFFVGGLICCICQVLIDKTALTPARILTGCVVSGVILGAVGLYPALAHWAGAGAATPLTGFGNLLAEGTREAVDRDGLLGALTGPLTAAAGGITAAVLFGTLAALVFPSREK